ncbi:nuclear pore complex protein Nup214 isoform X2 [Phlebotomus papatasi]|uniref:nuclear pore complex protein Nup214 isoform X2 n=1 Tax=Phlebotomus papatasi TaxID=29031 RepID=UPI002483E8AA|nr:nuclear pore complex protein Nup214 isoform X2 [Phlebotomus papatasi]
MVEKAPDFIDVTEVQFKLQSRVRIFSADVNTKPNCQLVATASAFGLVFVASPQPELKVIQLSALTGDKAADEAVPIRTIPLPSEATQIAVNCDNTLLAVDVVINGITMIILYAIQSFLSQHVKALHNIRLSPDNGVRSKQLAWNPTIPGVLAVCLENGALSMFVLKDQGFEFHTVDKSQAISSVCWSPKGKQIVAGCPGGRLIQYKPDLKAIRIIECPLDQQSGPLQAISIQWLSTYQFAVAFAPAEPSPPCLYVVNAPKIGQISCINYEDICYSGSGPRQTQVYLIHILPWNTLLVASANSMEVGVLATNETGDAPVWRQWCMLDEARAELPLTAKKQESYPIGFSLETGCTHRLTIGETEMPVMPMIHLLSTDGVLVSFNILNTIQNVPGICSPPRPLQDTTGLGEFVMAAPMPKPPPVQTQAPPVSTGISMTASKESELNLSMAPTAASTPVIQQKAKPIFGNSETFKAPTSVFVSIGQQSVNKPVASFGVPNENVPKTVNTTVFGGGIGGQMTALPFGSVANTGKVTTPAAPAPVKAAPKPQAAPVSLEQSKPFITVPPNYSASQTSERKPAPEKSSAVIPLDEENNAVIQKMIAEEVHAFEKDLKEITKRSQNISTQIGSQETLSSITKQLRELTDLTDQATESNDSLSADVRLLTMSLNEAFMMTAEAKSKWEVVANPTYTNINLRSGVNQTNRRQLSKLQAMLTNNRVHLEEINKQIDSTWVLHEEEKKQYKKDRMRVPKMEVIYQTINVQREILMGQQKRLNDIKQKLDIKLTKKTPNIQEIDSLSDSIVSLALVEQVEAETKKLGPNKMKKLQDLLKGHTVRTIHPKRPERKGINSEIVQEKREAAARIKTSQAVQQSPQPSMPAPSFSFGGTLNPTQPIKVIDTKAPPPARPVAKAKPPTSKSIPQTESKPPSFVATKAPLGGFEASKPFTSTVPSIFQPKSETKAFTFGATKVEVEEKKPPQQEVVFGTKPTIAVTTKPSIASPTVAALLTKNGGSNENAKRDVKDEKSSEQTKTTPFSFNIQKSPLGVFNQGNKAGPVFAPVSSSVAATTATTSIFSQLAAASSVPSSTSIFSTLSSFGSLAQTAQTDSVAKSDKPVAVATTAPTTANLSSSTGFTITPMAALEATVLSTPATTTTAAVTKEADVPKKEDTGFKFAFPIATTPSATKETSISVPAVVSTTPSTAAATSTISKTTTTTVTTSSSAFDADNLLKNLSFCQPNVAEKAPDEKPFSVFSLGNFGASTATTTTPTATSSIFASTAKTTTSSIFGGNTSTTTTTSAQAAPVTSAEPFKVSFGSMTITSTPVSSVAQTTTTTTSPPAGFFSGVIKPDPQPFGAQSTATTTTVASPFASLTTSSAASTSPFGGTLATTTSTSPFGSSGGSLFGSSSGFQVQSQNENSSVFGTPNKSSTGIFGGSSVFGQPSTPSSTGSIFGGSMTPNTGSSIFGGGATTPTTSTTSVFGGGSVFGGTQAAPQSSVFGGGSTNSSTPSSGFGFGQQQQQTSSVFGSPSAFGGGSSFGSPSGAFAQGGPSVAQTGFGSPNAFAKPTPTFGSPLKSTGFGSFSLETNNTFSAPTNQQNNLFAALGSSDTGMTFGNLAQNNNANQAKMQFGGSAFSTWRQ